MTEKERGKTGAGGSEVNVAGNNQAQKSVLGKISRIIARSLESAK